MKGIKVKVYGRWTSHIYMEQNFKPLAIVLSRVGEGVEGER
jgi:hypothetical protein